MFAGELNEMVMGSEGDVLEFRLNGGTGIRGWKKYCLEFRGVGEFRSEGAFGSWITDKKEVDR
ncbi:hypothetical protein, partial [Neisseria sicca]|uniref:hypothetical protein n=1 Tax=Neisseria sicca TaxID=490 RepID=UPI001C99357A